MPRRSIEAFDPKGIRIGKRFYKDKYIDRIIAAAGLLPAAKIDHQRVREDGASFESVTVTRREALTDRLETAAHVWSVESDFAAKPTAKQLAGEFEDIEKAAGELLEKLHLSKDSKEIDLGNIPPALRFGEFEEAKQLGGFQAFAAEEAEQLGGFPEFTAEGLLQDAVTGVRRLRDWSGAAKEHNLRKGSTPRVQRHSGDAALDALFGNLADIWVDIWNRPIGTSTGKSSGTKEVWVGGPMVRFIRESLRPILGDELPSDGGIRDRVRYLFKDKGKSDHEKT